jgi:hypothetical protein
MGNIRNVLKIANIVMVLEMKKKIIVSNALIISLF